MKYILEKSVSKTVENEGPSTSAVAMKSASPSQRKKKANLKGTQGPVLKLFSPLRRQSEANSISVGTERVPTGIGCRKNYGY